MHSSRSHCTGNSQLVRWYSAGAPESSPPYLARRQSTTALQRKRLSFLFACSVRGDFIEFAQSPPCFLKLIGRRFDENQNSRGCHPMPVCGGCSLRTGRNRRSWHARLRSFVHWVPQSRQLKHFAITERKHWHWLAHSTISATNFHQRSSGRII